MIQDCCQRCLSCCFSSYRTISQEDSRITTVAQEQLKNLPFVLELPDSIQNIEFSLEEEPIFQNRELIPDLETLQLPSTTTVLYRNILKKNDSFFLSYALYLWEHISINNSSEFLEEFLNNCPSTLKEEIKMILENGLDFQNNQKMSSWVFLLRIVAGSALENAINPEETYYKILQEIQKEKELLNLSPIFNQNAFQILVQHVQYGDIPATPTLIEAFFARLQKKVSIFQDHPNLGLIPHATPDTFPLIGNVLYRQESFYPIEIPFRIVPLKEDKIRIQVRAPHKPLFTGYAVALLHICYHNKDFIKKYKILSNLPFECKNVVKKALTSNSPEDFQKWISNILPVQIVAKNLELLWRSDLENSEALTALMEVTRIPIQVKTEEETLFSQKISYGSLVLDENSALYIPAKEPLLSTLYYTFKTADSSHYLYSSDSRKKEIETYFKVKNLHTITLPPNLLSSYELLCKRGQVFEENRRILPEDEVQPLLQKEENKLMQIVKHPTTQQSQSQLQGIGDFTYYPQYNSIDSCLEVLRHQKNIEKSKGSIYYHTTKTCTISEHFTVEHSSQGTAHPYMEDRSLVSTFTIPSLDLKPILVVGIFDGHGGDICADLLKANFSPVLQKHLELFSDKTLYPDFTLDSIAYNALRQTIVELDSALEEGSGSTATVSVKIGPFLYTGNTGDSRTLLVTPNTWKQLSIDAEANEEPHKTIIAQLGGKATKRSDEFSHRINNIIGMGSSVGDHKVIGTNPTVTVSKTDLTQYPNSILIAVSDGVTDVATSYELATTIQEAYFTNEISLTNLGISLGYSFFKNRTYDNTTLILADMKIP